MVGGDGWSPSLRVIEGDSIHLLPLFLQAPALASTRSRWSLPGSIPLFGWVVEVQTHRSSSGFQPVGVGLAVAGIGIVLDPLIHAGTVGRFEMPVMAA